MKNLLNLQGVRTLNKMELKTISGGIKTCSGAYDSCDAQHPSSWSRFNRCMHMAAACNEQF